MQHVNSSNFNENKKHIPLSEVTCHLIGDIGRWQCVISLLMSLLKITVPWVQLGIIFLAFPQDYWCKKPNNIDMSNEEWKNFSNPCIQSHKYCEIKNLNCTAENNALLASELFENSPRIPCKEFEYDQSIFKSTIISDWDLVCAKEYYVGFSQSSLMFGVLLGNLIFGIVSDKYGRRISLFWCIILQSLAGFTSALTPWFSVFIISRLILAIASGGITTVTFVLCLETVGGKWKYIIPILYHIPFGLGNSALAGIAYYMRSWRSIQITLSILSSTYLIFLIFILESPKWLLATGKHEEAIEVLKRICKYNKQYVNDIREVVSKSSRCEIKIKRTKISAIFVKKDLRFVSLILWIVCFLSGLSFFAFVQYVGIVGRNIFLNVALNGLSVIPGTVLALLLLKYCNYKKSIILSQIWTALCFLLMTVAPHDAFAENWPRIVLALLGIMGLSITLPILTIYIGLVYPTEVRNAGVGLAMMFSRLGSIISPFVIYLEKLSPTAPHVLLCVFTLLQAIMLSFMPNIRKSTDKTPMGLKQDINENVNAAILQNDY